jgi:type II secretory pathway component PulK
MKMRMKNNGVVFLMVIFAIALLTTITVGILIMSTEELLLMDNQLYAAQALCTAEAGLNDDRIHKQGVQRRQLHRDCNGGFADSNNYLYRHLAAGVYSRNCG